MKKQDALRLSTWVYSVAKNTALDFLREKKLSETALPEEGVANPETNVGSHCLHLELGIMGAIASALSEHEREAYFLGEVFGLQASLSGEALGITAECFRQRLSRARAKMREFGRLHCSGSATNRRQSCDFEPDTELNSSLLARTLEVLGENNPLGDTTGGFHPPQSSNSYFRNFDDHCGACPKRPRGHNRCRGGGNHFHHRFRQIPEKGHRIMV